LLKLYCVSLKGDGEDVVRVTRIIIILSPILLEGPCLDLGCNSIEMTGRRQNRQRYKDMDVDTQIYTNELQSSHGIDCHNYGILVSDAVQFVIQGVSKMSVQTSSVSSAHDNEKKKCS
jgi:hypothetical protein